MHVTLLMLVSWLCVSNCGNIGSEMHHTRHSSPKYLSSCPDDCLCIISDHYADTVDITCQNRMTDGLELPPLITSLSYTNVTTAYLQNSNIVPPSSDGSHMIKIVYRQSSIKKLSPFTFKNLQFLEHLDLSANFLSAIPETCFKDLVSLRVLNLTDNKLVSLPNNLFISQQHLSELYLAKNNLEKTFAEVYLNCIDLKILDLSFNRIKTLNDGTKLNSNIVVLLLNNNNLKDIPRNTLLNLKHLEILSLANNEINFISEEVFQRLNSLINLDIQSNAIAELPRGTFQGMTHLQVLNVSKNPISLMDNNLLRSNLELIALDISETHISQITMGLLARLKRLRVLNASHNHRLVTIEDFKLRSSNHLQYIDVSYGNLTDLPKFILHLEMVEQLRLEGNPWKCSCKSGWFPQWLANHRHLLNSSLVCDGSENMIETLKLLNCEPPSAVNETIAEILEFNSTVVLSCLFDGEPAPSITWITPSGYIFHYYPSNNATDIFYNHPRIHLYDLEPTAESRIKVLLNGSIQIEQLLRQDAGIYTCIAINSLGNATSHIIVTLDRNTFFHIKIMGIIVGASCVAAVLICTAISQLIYHICKRCGLVEERGKQLNQLRENLDQYRSQQLQNLRENYTQQVHRIKENCALQVEWTRDSYKAQVKHLRDFKHYGSHQLTSIRDQYYDQIKKVRDYSTTQLGWVRENYVFQRNRVQKFSSHQVLRFRESYKYQQQTLNKILENLPNLHLDNCRGSSCSRSESPGFVEPTDIDPEIQAIDIFVQNKVKEMTQPSVLDEVLDDQSIYYTPTELSDSPLSPIQERMEKVLLCPDVDPMNQPSTSHSAIPWLEESPCHVFHNSQSNLQCPSHGEFQVPRTLQSSTSLPEMPQLSDDDVSTLRPAAGGSHETSL